MPTPDEQPLKACSTRPRWGAPSDASRYQSSFEERFGDYVAGQILDNLPNASALFKPQGRHGIDTSRSLGWNPDGDQGDYGKQQRSRDENEGVQGLDAK
jgi:hypothetical protein